MSATRKRYEVTPEDLDVYAEHRAREDEEKATPFDRAAAEALQGAGGGQQALRDWYCHYDFDDRSMIEDVRGVPWFITTGTELIESAELCGFTPRTNSGPCWNRALLSWTHSPRTPTSRPRFPRSRRILCCPLGRSRWVPAGGSVFSVGGKSRCRSGGGGRPPEGLPLPRSLRNRARRWHTASAPSSPHRMPAALQPLAHHRLARALHRPAADLPALGQVARVVHPMHLVAEVRHHLAVNLPHGPRLAPQVQPAQRRQHRPASLVLQPVAPLLPPAPPPPPARRGAAPWPTRPGTPRRGRSPGSPPPPAGSCRAGSPPARCRRRDRATQRSARSIPTWPPCRRSGSARSASGRTWPRSAPASAAAGRRVGPPQPVLGDRVVDHADVGHPPLGRRAARPLLADAGGVHGDVGARPCPRRPCARPSRPRAERLARPPAARPTPPPAASVARSAVDSLTRSPASRARTFVGRLGEAVLHAGQADRLVGAGVRSAAPRPKRRHAGQWPSAAWPGSGSRPVDGGAARAG